MLETPPSSNWRIALPRGATAVPIARAMVRCALQDLGTTADRTTAQLLTAELVANALKHTGGDHPIELVVERGPDGCQVEVHDGDTVLVEGLGEPAPMAMLMSAAGPGEPLPMTGPRATGPGTTGPGTTEPGTTGPGAPLPAPAAPVAATAPRVPAIRNRGLLLVRSLSSGSGCRRTQDGKAVWFTLPEVHRTRRR
ncbi:ATP-binding protein [Streptomyces endophytica]|uniref:ATP-binding protein n=1 Tax=Streptomyces endophytica TaxID=2991496 RepID=A0ABY6PIQ5_9ACTN|nr:ATP-binding protein [Streptomyces endophytica]UZJ33774.1 ATP-binding protein [Streptomyces endophytica]